ncbi:MAG: hypothetical protein ACXWOV_09600 [Isosphaeraceae bacterium]
MESLAGLFGVEVAAFDVLSNHLHVILRIRPDVGLPSGPIRRSLGAGWPSSLDGRGARRLRRWRHRGVFREHPVKFAVVSVRVASGMLR